MGIFIVGIGDSQKKSTPLAPSVVSQSDSGSNRGFDDGASYLTFSDALFDGKLPIIDYLVTAVSETNETLTFTITNLNPYVATGFKSGIKYRYRIKARNAIGYSDDSSDVGPTPASTVPGRPTSVTSIDLRTGGGIQVSWQTPPNGGLPITGYTITPSVGSPIQTNDTATSYTFTGTVGTPVSFTITARNNNGTGLASTASSAVSPTNAPVVAPPPPPVGPSGPSIDITSISASGTSSGSNCGAQVSWTGYGYQSYRVTVGSVSGAVTNGTGTSATITSASIPCSQNVSVSVTVWAGTNGTGSSATRSTTVTTPTPGTSGGPTVDLVSVPDVGGLTPDGANSLIQAVRLIPFQGGTLTNTSGATSSNNGTVGSQSPAAGTLVQSNSTVTYRVYAYTAPPRVCGSQYGEVSGPINSGSCPDGSCSNCTSYQIYYYKCDDGTTNTSSVGRYQGLGCTTGGTTGPTTGPTTGGRTVTGTYNEYRATCCAIATITTYSDGTESINCNGQSCTSTGPTTTGPTTDPGTGVTPTTPTTPPCSSLADLPCRCGSQYGARNCQGVCECPPVDSTPSSGGTTPSSGGTTPSSGGTTPPPPPPSGGGCFAGKTLISTPNGLVKAEDIKVGDIVHSIKFEELSTDETRDTIANWWSTSLTPKEVNTAKVMALQLIDEADYFICLNGDYVTPDHIVLTNNNGLYKFKAAGDIHLGELVLKRGGDSVSDLQWVPITSNDFVQERTTIYLFDTEDDDVIFSENMLSHNRKLANMLQEHNV